MGFQFTEELNLFLESVVADIRIISPLREDDMIDVFQEELGVGG
jgi:hypothetical protein